MTADLDLSPEAVERLLSLPRLYLDDEGDLCCARNGYNLVACPAVGDQPTDDLLNPDMWEAIPQYQALACALAADNERLTVEIDRLAAALDEMTRRRNAWREKAAGYDELRASVRAGIEQAGGRNLSRVFLRGALVESEKSLAEAVAENARLRAERDEQRERAEEAESEITRAQEQVSAEFEGDCWKTLRNLLDRTGFDWSGYSEDGVTASDAQEWIVEELDRLEAELASAWQAGAEAMRDAAVASCADSWDDSAWSFVDRIRALPLPGQTKEDET